jgi:hypothetical protein
MKIEKKIILLIIGCQLASIFLLSLQFVWSRAARNMYEGTAEQIGPAEKMLGFLSSQTNSASSILDWQQLVSGLVQYSNVANAAHHADLLSASKFTASMEWLSVALSLCVLGSFILLIQLLVKRQ